MNPVLTKKQVSLLEWLPTLSGRVELYEDDSLNGLSWTLRYRHMWAEPGSVYPRQASHMIFAVRKPEDEKDDARVYAERMKPKVDEARRVFLAAAERLKK